jgi:hypothetical protein
LNNKKFKEPFSHLHHLHQLLMLLLALLLASLLLSRLLLLQCLRHPHADLLLLLHLNGARLLHARLLHETLLLGLLLLLLQKNQNQLMFI